MTEQRTERRCTMFEQLVTLPDEDWIWLAAQAAGLLFVLWLRLGQYGLAHRFDMKEMKSWASAHRQVRLGAVIGALITGFQLYQGSVGLIGYFITWWACEWFAEVVELAYLQKTAHARGVRPALY